MALFSFSSFCFKKKISVLIYFYLFIAYVYMPKSEFKCTAGVQAPREASRGHEFPLELR